MKPQNLLMKSGIKILLLAIGLFFWAPPLSLALPAADTTPAQRPQPQPILTTLLSPPPFIPPRPQVSPLPATAPGSAVTPSPPRAPAPAPSAATPGHPAPAVPVILRILNDSGIRNYANIVLDWELRANGLVRQKGSLTNLPIPPKHPAIVRLPVRIAPQASSNAGTPTNTGAPPNTGNEELFLGLRYHYRNKPAAPGHTATPGAQAPASPILAEEQFLLKPWSNSQLSIRPTGELSFTDENGSFTIQSPIILIRFDKQTGWLQQYTVKDSQLLADTSGCKTSLWLEPADPDYNATDAAGSGVWKEASQSPHLQLFSTSTGSQLVIVRTEYTLPETACLLHLSYTINAAGEMEVEQAMEADSSHQGEPLPCFGMYWLLPPGFDSVTAYGNTLVTAYGNTPVPRICHFPVIPPRETGPYTGVRWWAITRPDGKGLRLTADSALLTISTAPVNTGTAPTSPTTTGLRLNINTPATPYRLPYGNYRYAYKLTPLLPEEKPGIRK